MNVALLASDLDGTLIPYEESAEQRQALARFREWFAGASPRDGRPLLAYVTGRHLALAEHGIAAFGLPRPDVLVCDVGTALYRRTVDGWRKDAAYEERLARSWPGAPAVAGILDGIPGLDPQEEACQGPLKRSYYLPLDAAGSMAQEARRRLRRAGMAARVILSIDHRRECGLLDVLPPAAAKDAALAYLATELAVSLEEVVYAGDSGNDIEAFASGCRGIVVGNADEQLRRALAPWRTTGRLYFSRAAYAAGVVEGCRRFGITPPWPLPHHTPLRDP